FIFLCKDKMKDQSLEHLIEIYIKANKLAANGQAFDFNKVNSGEPIAQGFLEPDNKDVFAKYIAVVDAIITGIIDSIVLAGKRFNSPITQAVVTGGGANSPWLLQKIADAVQININKPKTEQAGCLGVAITLAVNKGLYSNYQQAVKQMCQLDAVYLPSSKNNN
ncbi:MAG: FGGY-family carbohydrate kinase, partial [Thalassotalea sp.]|nr:FGGY-family carbohydrate kinase [Thalassotalea sp.]